jgi:hypothetical protein
MIQLVVNVDLLREIDERKLINAYARYEFNNDKSVIDSIEIKSNLEELLNWDINGDNGLGLYCGKFESIKTKDWNRLIKFIQDNGEEISKIAIYNNFSGKRELENQKILTNVLEKKELHRKERFTDENYQVSGRGKKARPCVYEGKEYKSRQECMYKEGLTKYHLWKYLKDTNQI